MKRFDRLNIRLGLQLSLLAGLLAGMLVLSGTRAVHATSSVTVPFNYTGGVQTWIVPPNVTQVNLDVFGAQGGYNAAEGGLGGEATATVSVTPGETLTIVVGGMGHSPFNGQDASGGFNGGGNGGAPYNLPSSYYGSGGGGATDIRADGTDLANRIIVAGGGGGAANEFGPDGSSYGGVGGGLTGGTGNSAYVLYAPSGGAGGNQDGSTGSGQLGTGSSGADNSSNIFNGVGGGGGGGGYYGGMGGVAGTGGGGGSGFGPVGTVFNSGVNTGNGSVIITYELPDTTPPTITINIPANGATYRLNQSVNADYSCADEAGGSGIGSCVGTVSNGGPIDTSSVGVKSFTVDAQDNAGNTSSVSVTYNVTYNFEGFYSPVDNSTMNLAKAGQGIPLKWLITDADGVPVTDLTTATINVQSLTCDLGTTGDLINEVASGNSGLQNLGNGYYQFNWKTPNSYQNSCKTMMLNLGEGTGFEHTAMFKFTH